VSDFSVLKRLAREDSFPIAAAPEGDKASIRRAVLSARRSMSPSVRAIADALIAAVLRSVVDALKPRLICAYVPMAGEPGGAFDLGVPTLLPVLRPDLDLDWARSSTLVPGRLGLREPSGPRLGVSAIAEADLVIAPGVAVSVDGVRLGRGGGSYDRALARASGPVLVALYDGEVYRSLPAEPHDHPVDAVVTQSGVRLTGRKRPA
jgi:5-formyltetrahydrofolate cyclo-ligase